MAVPACPAGQQGRRQHHGRRAALSARADGKRPGLLTAAARADLAGADLTGGGPVGLAEAGRAGLAGAGRAGAGLLVAGLLVAGLLVAGLLAGCGPAPASGGKSGSDPGTGAAGAGNHTGLRTSCRSVAHIGDSTSVGLISPAFLPNPATRLAARYRDVGVTHVRIDASAGRSIVGHLPGQVDGYNVASAWRSAGYQGCWVIALGTNDAAEVAGGSAVGLAARISQMMSVIGNQPVLWVGTWTQTSSGPWALANEQEWNRTLIRALGRYPNMRIFDWGAVARPAWFFPDGIHYNAEGCARRARAIASALALAFPANGHSRTRIVK